MKGGTDLSYLSAMRYKGAALFVPTAVFSVLNRSWAMSVVFFRRCSL
jgi:hypothetical protein